MADTLTFAANAGEAIAGWIRLVVICFALVLIVLGVLMPLAVARIWTHTHATQQAVKNQTALMEAAAADAHEALAAQLAQMQETQRVLEGIAAEIRSQHNDFKT